MADGRSVWAAEQCRGMSCATSDLPPILKFDHSSSVQREGYCSSLGGRRSRGTVLIHSIKPADVVVAPNGDIFIADGHGGSNARIVKFSKDGAFIRTWGNKGRQEGISAYGTRWPWTTREGYWLVIGATTGSRSLIRTGVSLMNGDSWSS